MERETRSERETCSLLNSIVGAPSATRSPTEYIEHRRRPPSASTAAPPPQSVFGRRRLRVGRSRRCALPSRPTLVGGGHGGDDHLWYSWRRLVEEEDTLPRDAQFGSAQPHTAQPQQPPVRSAPQRTHHAGGLPMHNHFAQSSAQLRGLVLPGKHKAQQSPLRPTLQRRRANRQNQHEPQFAVHHRVACQ